MSNGTIGGSTHGYGPIGGGISSLMNTGGGTMNINVYKGGTSNNTQNIKDSISFSKINSKMKKKQFNNNLTGLQQSCNTNPSRGNQPTEGDREGSVDASSTYKNRAGTQGRNGRERDGSEGKLYQENSYLTTQVERGASIGVNEYHNDASSLNGTAGAISPRAN